MIYFGTKFEAWLSEKICKCLLINGPTLTLLPPHCANHMRLPPLFGRKLITQAFDMHPPKRWPLIRSLHIGAIIRPFYTYHIHGNLKHLSISTPALTLGYAPLEKQLGDGLLWLDARHTVCLLSLPDACITDTIEIIYVKFR